MSLCSFFPTVASAADTWTEHVKSFFNGDSEKKAPKIEYNEVVIIDGAGRQKYFYSIRDGELRHLYADDESERAVQDPQVLEE